MIATLDVERRMRVSKQIGDIVIAQDAGGYQKKLPQINVCTVAYRHCGRVVTKGGCRMSGGGGGKESRGGREMLLDIWYLGCFNDRCLKKGSR
jgi:hypothetical protein